MIDLNEQKEYFKNHEAKFIDYRVKLTLITE